VGNATEAHHENSIDSNTIIVDTECSENTSNTSSVLNSSDSQTRIGIKKPYQTIVPVVSDFCQSKSAPESSSENGHRDVYKLFDPNEIEFDDSNVLHCQDFEEEGSDDDYGNELYIKCL
jgi:hypothetical protein